MKQLSGLVLVKETGIGVPNLVVAIFDVENGARDDGKAGRDIGSRMVGRRIASVMTDASGRFSFSAADFDPGETEIRPDLSLAVLAPEDVQGVDRPYSLPAEDRTLYMSSMPRVDAGAVEAYVIRLLQKQLDQYQIGAATSRSVDRETDLLVAASLRASRMRTAIRDALEDETKQSRRDTRSAREEAKEKVASLSAIPRPLRDARVRKKALLIADRADLADELPEMQQAAVANAMDRLRASPSLPPMRLYLSEKDVKKLELKVEGNKISGEVSADKLRKRIPGISNVTDLVRNHNTSQPSLKDLEELERRYGLLPKQAEKSRETASDRSEYADADT